MTLSVENLIQKEKKRQKMTLNLIASENYVSKNVLEATGSVLTNKYAEGYPNRRYYGGCSVVDEIEKIALDRGKKLFKAEHCNVQPHSGSSANMAVYFSALSPGDTVLGMSLSSGGHLTHGHHVNFSGKFYNFISYGVDRETELLDYTLLEELAQTHKPKMIVVGASAYSRTIDFEKCAEIAKNCGALLLADIAHIAGLIATDLHPSPTSADFVSTTTHKTLRGPRGGMILCKKKYAENIDKTIMPGMQGGPLMHVIAAKALAFEESLQPSFKKYQKRVLENAQTMVQEFKNRGYRIVADGTDNHLFLVDIKSKNKNLNGKIVEEVLEKCGIIVNRNTIPYDQESPFLASGIRIGTPAMTTRGFSKDDAVQIVAWIDEIIMKKDDDRFLKLVRQKVEDLCQTYPLFPE